MPRAGILTLLASSLLFAGTLQAQRGGGTIRGGFAQARVGSGVGHRAPGSSRFHNGRGGAGFYPFWDDEGFWGDEADEDEGAALPPLPGFAIPGIAPPGMMLQSGRTRAARAEIPAASPKLIELPGAADSAAGKPLPSAMFILVNGERIEVRRYLITHDRMYLTVDHQQRTIPLAMLDISATVAANHERGIEMRIPADPSEISLSF